MSGDRGPEILASRVAGTVTGSSRSCKDLLSNSFKFGRGTEVHLLVKSLPEARRVGRS